MCLTHLIPEVFCREGLEGAVDESVTAVAVGVGAAAVPGLRFGAAIQ